ncbi:MAG: hypothetical protein QNJ16_14445 [Rhodobacter sp.]|nr:hypothetical protein [Rhodobacter sp.]
MIAKMRFPSSLLLATALLAGGLADPALAQSSGEHFACYDIDPAGRFEEMPVQLKDQFAAYEGVVIRPVSLCNPVDKNGEGLTDPEHHLVCYEIKADPIGSAPRAVDVVTSNQFTEQPMTAVLPPRLLCVPSKKEVL